MIRFNNDYNRTAHPRVWEVLQQAAQESHPGYGTDDWCARAESIIRGLTGQPEAAVWFFPGATQANFIVISAALSPVESVICAETGHIQCHEAASVEHVGHKLLALPATDGKITAEQIAECAAAYYEGGEPEYWTAPEARLHLLPDRIRHALQQGGAGGDPRRVQNIWDVSVRRRRAGSATASARRGTT